jgi:hypothetical protein
VKKVHVKAHTRKPPKKRKAKKGAAKKPAQLELF